MEQHKVKILLNGEIIEKQVITTINDFFAGERKGQWIKIGHAYFPLTAIKKHIRSTHPVIYDGDAMLRC